MLTGMFRYFNSTEHDIRLPDLEIQWGEHIKNASDNGINMGRPIGGHVGSRQTTFHRFSPITKLQSFNVLGLG
jgi:hypothetical protein